MSVEVALELASGNIDALQYNAWASLPAVPLERVHVYFAGGSWMRDCSARQARPCHLLSRWTTWSLLEPPALPEDLEPRALAPSLELQTSDLLVSATWIRLHAPRIQDLEVSSLQSNDGRAARRLRCHAEGSDCAREVSVVLYIVLYIALLHRVLLHIV